MKAEQGPLLRRKHRSYAVKLRSSRPKLPGFKNTVGFYLYLLPQLQLSQPFRTRTCLYSDLSKEARVLLSTHF